MARTQVARTAAVATTLGDDILLLKKMSGEEELGRLFEYELELLSEHEEIDYDRVLGQPIAVRLDVDGEQERFFHGIVSRFEQGAIHSDGHRTLATYRATVSPWFWLLTRTTDCRIYQHKSVVEIIRDVFKEFGFSQYMFRLSEKYPKRDYCVQYRESYFNFLSRLMEHEGIYYYFEHDAQGHTMILCDSISGHRTEPGFEQIPYKPQQERDESFQRISRWSVRRQVQPGVYKHGDFDFKKPSIPLRMARSDPRPHAHSAYQVFDYPGGWVEFDEGDRLARIRQEEINARHEVVWAASDVRVMRTGMAFRLVGHPREDQNREYLVTHASYRIVLDNYQSSSADDPLDEDVFSCEVSAIDAKVPFRPQRTTPKARVEGPQTAIVAGPARDPNEEIYTDRTGHGRVKVRFHWDWYWDGEEHAEEDSSCWIRVSQAWAGKGWGGLQVPRVGQEVIVDFINGDPDRPIITGRVYNGEQKPPQKLPASKATSSMRSQSYPGGGGSNEISMDDTKGKEGIYIHAQYDKTIEVGHDRSTMVGNDDVVTVANNRQAAIGVNDVLGVGQNRVEQIGANKKVDIGENELVTVGQNIKITAGTSITLQCGSAMIHMNQAGVILIKGQLINIQGGIFASVAAPITTVSGDLLLNDGVLNVSNGSVVNKVMGNITTIDGNPVKINAV